MGYYSQINKLIVVVMLVISEAEPGKSAAIINCIMLMFIHLMMIYNEKIQLTYESALKLQRFVWERLIITPTIFDLFNDEVDSLEIK